MTFPTTLQLGLRLTLTFLAGNSVARSSDLPYNEDGKAANHNASGVMQGPGPPNATIIVVQFDNFTKQTIHELQASVDEQDSKTETMMVANMTDNKTVSDSKSIVGDKLHDRVQHILHASTAETILRITSSVAMCSCWCCMVPTGGGGGNNNGGRLPIAWGLNMRNYSFREIF